MKVRYFWILKNTDTVMGVFIDMISQVVNADVVLYVRDFTY